MIIMIAATALAAAQPNAAPAPSGVMAEHAMHGEAGGHPSAPADCCKHCCKDMAAKHEGHAEQKDHSGE